MKNGRLRGRIVEKYGRISDFATAMGVSQSAMSLLLNGKSGWRGDKIEEAIRLLDIPSGEVAYYFFPKVCEVGDKQNVVE